MRQLADVEISWLAILRGTPNDGNSYVCELFVGWSSTTAQSSARRRSVMDGIIYLVGLIVIIMFILSFLGLH